MSQTKKIILLATLFIYTVLCGIMIADIGTSSVAGSTRPHLLCFLNALNPLKTR